MYLKEKLADGKLEDRGRVTVTPDLNGNPVDVVVTHVPTEVGEKTYILSVPAVPGETNTRNNQIERTVLVTESRKIRVLYVEGYPRYDFRFVKVMLERESDKSIGGKAVEVQVVLLDASKGWAETDRSAFRGDFPTRTELFSYDVVVLGDVDPKQVPRLGHRTSRPRRLREGEGRRVAVPVRRTRHPGGLRRHAARGGAPRRARRRARWSRARPKNCRSPKASAPSGRPLVSSTRCSCCRRMWVNRTASGISSRNCCGSRRATGPSH